MRYTALAEKVKELAEPVVDELGLELVDVVYATESGRRILRVIIDGPGGVTIDDCTMVSRELGTLLDVEDVVPESYSLEVSSPGLDRPLVREKDFRNAVGKQIRLRTKEPLDGRRNFRAVLVGVGDDSVTLEDSEGRLWKIELSNIDKARLEVVL